MTQTSLYTPAYVTVLRRWLLAAGLVLMIGAYADWLRTDMMVMKLHGVTLLAVAVLFAALSQGRGRHALAVVTASAAVAVNAYAFALGRQAAFDIWVAGWLLAVPLACIASLSSPRARTWMGGGNVSSDFVESGLAHNKRAAHRLDSIGKHTLLLHAVAVVLLPVVWITDVAVSPGNILGGAIGDAFSLEHFTKVLGGSEFPIWLRNSVVVAIGTTVCGMALAVPAAYALSRYRFSGRTGTLFLFALVQMFPGAMILVPFFLVMKTLGLLNSAISLIIVYSVTTIPLCVWMLKGYIDSIPIALEEAALLDGCSQFTVLWRIVLPLSLPALLVTCLFSFLAAWNEFLLALTFNTSNDQFTLPVGLASMIPATGQRWGDFAAASIMVSTPVVVLFFFFQRALIGGMAAGGVKG